MMKALKFILIDDNEMFRKTLRSILINQYGAVILAEASNASDVLRMNILHLADIILMDIMMPGKNGIELTKDLLWQYKRLNIIAMTMHIDKVYLMSLVEAGFKGCIFKTDFLNQLNDALETVTKGHFFFPEDLKFEQ